MAEAEELALALAVADAVDAWLGEPSNEPAARQLLDTVDALRAWRAARAAQEAIPGTSRDDELLDQLADNSPPSDLASLLSGSATEILARSRENPTRADLPPGSPPHGADQA
ncbi:MAG: hypothetical protein ACRDNS_27765 [Trebonia sp.]